MGKSSREFAAPSRKTTFSFSNNGQSHEGNESDGSHEGHACYEEEGSEQDCEGQDGKVSGLPWHQGQDRFWTVQDRLEKSKSGKIVSKKQSAAGKKAYANIKGWTVAVQKARKALGVKGFVAVKKGTPLYKKAKELFQ